MYNFYDELRNKTFKKVQEELSKNITDENLLNIFSKPVWDTGVIRNCSQNTVHNFYPLVSHKQWEIRYAYYADENNMCSLIDKKAPVFVDVETYLDWEELRKDKERFEREWRDHKFIHSRYDSEMFDGNAQIWFNSRDMLLPSACDDAQEKFKKRKNLKPDEIAIIMRVYASSECLGEFEKSQIRDYGTVFVLSPVAESEDERKLIIAKHFKDIVINRYARYLMNQYDEKLIDDWSQKVLNGSIETKL